MSRLNLGSPSKPGAPMRATPARGWGARSSSNNLPHRGRLVQPKDVAYVTESSADDGGEAQGNTGSGVDFCVGDAVEPPNSEDETKAVAVISVKVT